MRFQPLILPKLVSVAFTKTASSMYCGAIRSSLQQRMSSSTSNTSLSPASSLKVAAIAQLRSTSNKFQNLQDIAKCARLAKAQGASMLFLPECFGFLGESSAQTLEEAEDPTYLYLDGGVGGAKRQPRDGHKCTHCDHFLRQQQQQQR